MSREPNAPMNRTEEVAPAIDAVTRWCERAIADLVAMNHDFGAALATEPLPSDDVPRLAKSAQAALKRRVRDFLRAHPHVDGAGVIFSRSTVGGGNGAIEWWVRDGDGELSRYAFGLNPVGARFYDYENFEWFTVSSESGRPWLTGPYIDYLGVEEYIVTLTTGVVVDGRAVGVSGLDIRMGDFERELFPLVSRFPGAAVLLNSHGGVLVSSTSRFATGDLLRDTPAGFIRVDLPLDGVRLAIVYEDAAGSIA